MDINSNNILFQRELTAGTNISITSEGKKIVISAAGSASYHGGRHIEIAADGAINVTEDFSDQVDKNTTDIIILNSEASEIPGLRTDVNNLTLWLNSESDRLDDVEARSKQNSSDINSLWGYVTSESTTLKDYADYKVGVEEYERDQAILSTSNRLENLIYTIVPVSPSEGFNYLSGKISDLEDYTRDWKEYVNDTVQDVETSATESAVREAKIYIDSQGLVNYETMEDAFDDFRDELNSEGGFAKKSALKALADDLQQEIKDRTSEGLTLRGLINSTALDVMAWADSEFVHKTDLPTITVQIYNAILSKIQSEGLATKDYVDILFMLLEGQVEDYNSESISRDDELRRLIQIESDRITKEISDRDSEDSRLEQLINDTAADILAKAMAYTDSEAVDKIHEVTDEDGLLDNLTIIVGNVADSVPESVKRGIDNSDIGSAISIVDDIVTISASGSTTNYTSFDEDGMKVVVNGKTVAETNDALLTGNSGLGVQNWIIKEGKSSAVLNIFRSK